LKTPTDRARCDATCRRNLELAIQQMTRQEFDKSDSLIEPILDKKAAELFKQNESYLAELERIKPTYEQVSAELKSVKDKQDQLDTLFDSGVRALDTWAKTHANLRVAVNTKRPLTISNLASNVRDIWAIVDPATK
jgi:predicted nuclease with TOPRIM domain